MIELAREDFYAVIAEARLAPSVHNVQPSRWRLRGNKIELLGDLARTIPNADPASRDWRLSHGAAFEGLSIALARKGLGIVLDLIPADHAARIDGSLQPIATASVISATTYKMDHSVATRTSWRGRFQANDAETETRLDELAASRQDLHLIRARNDITDTARLADAASLYFLRDPAHRRELLHWMRLSRRHPQFDRDGLNASAMHMNTVEAWGAELVLGPLFSSLDRVGVAAPLTSEYSKTNTAAAIAVFHRPIGEDPFHSGRAFYRAWLAMEAASLKGCAMSVLADWSEARLALHQKCKLGPDSIIVNAFRIGRPETPPAITHARLPVDELIL
jgi:nitroreductase